MTTKVSINRRWTEPVPVGRNGRPIPSNQWARKRSYVWLVRWFLVNQTGQPIRRSRQFATRAEAEGYQAEKQAELGQSPAARAAIPAITLSAYISEWTAKRSGPKGNPIKRQTVDLGRRWLDRLAGHVDGDTPLAKITRADAVGFFASIRDDHQPATLDQGFRAIRTCFNTAIKVFGYITINPFSGLKVADVPDPDIRIVSAAEFAALIDACPDIWWRTLLTVAYTAGLRLGELENLTWADVDFERNEIKVSATREGKRTLFWMPKTRKSLRTLPSPESTTALLDQLRWSGFLAGAYVFLPASRVEFIKTAQTAGVWHVDKRSQLMNDFHLKFRRLVLSASEAVPSLINDDKKPDVHMHDLRRSLATRLSEQVTPQTLMAIMGHSRIETTMKYYAAVTDAQLEKARQAAASMTAMIDAQSV